MPKAPPQRCTTKGCGRFATNQGRCDNHQHRTGWDEYRRTHGINTTAQRLGITQQTWDTLRAIVLTEHQGRCHWCGKPGATVIDHIIAVGLGGSKTSKENLAPIHQEPCHRDKTSQELVEMKKRKQGRGNPGFQPIRRVQNPNPYTPDTGSQKTETSTGIRSL